MGEQEQRRLLRGMIVIPVVGLAALVPLAFIFTSERSEFVMAIGLAFELSAVLAILIRAVAEEVGFWHIRGEADHTTLRLFYGGAALLPVGFSLQFIAVVFS